MAHSRRTHHRKAFEDILGTLRTKPSKKYSSAGCRVLQRIVELLECILLFLPVRDLVVMQRVCKFWNEGIRRSIAIRHQMFIKALPMGALGPSDGTPGHLPLLRNRNKHYSIADVEYNPLFTIGLQDKRTKKLAAKRWPILQHDSIIRFRRDWPTDILYFNRWYGDRRPHSTTSWRSMLLTQPPLSEITMWIWGPRWLERATIWHRRVTVKSLRGITMGDLMDQANQVLKSIWGGEEERQDKWNEVRRNSSLTDRLYLKLMGSGELLQLDNYGWCLTPRFEEDD